jgi:hypothetical protein
LRNADRATAWIATDSGSLQLDEIGKIYSTLVGDEE